MDIPELLTNEDFLLLTSQYDYILPMWSPSPGQDGCLPTVSGPHRPTSCSVAWDPMRREAVKGDCPRAPFTIPVSFS